MKEASTSAQTNLRKNDSTMDTDNESENNGRNGSRSSGINQNDGQANTKTSQMNNNDRNSDTKTSRLNNDDKNSEAKASRLNNDERNKESKTSRLNHDDNLSSKSTRSQNSNSKGKIEPNQLMQLFEAELKDIYWAEKELTRAIPKMVKHATSEELINALKMHLGETEEQVKRLENVFEVIGKKPTARKCEAMAGLVEEAVEIMEECEEGAMCDAGIISAAQKVEHYEIATYGTLRQFAETLGLKDAVNFLEKTLNEEKAADKKLTEIAVSVVNMEAASEPAGNSRK